MSSPVLVVAFSKSIPRLLLETVDRLLTVPDGLGKLVLLPQPILIDGPKRSPPHLLCLVVVGLVPHLLQLRMVPAHTYLLLPRALTKEHLSFNMINTHGLP